MTSRRTSRPHGGARPGAILGAEPRAFHAIVSRDASKEWASAIRPAARRGGSASCGWVRNLRDGDVEVSAEGEAEALADFREWLAGRPAGRSDPLGRTRKVVAPTGHYAEFSIE